MWYFHYSSILLVVVLFMLNVESSKAQTQIGTGVNGSFSGDQAGWSTSISDNGKVIAIGSPLYDGVGASSGQVRVFKWDGSSWVQQGSSIGGKASDNHFGWSVSLNNNGTVLAVGAPKNDGNGSNSGHVRVFKWNGSSWGQQGTGIYGESAGNWAGYSVNLSANGDTLAIGSADAYANSSDPGQARVYTWTGTSWVQLGSNIVGKSNGDSFGRSISLSDDGNTLAGGAPVGNGYVKVYEWNASTWVEKGKTFEGDAASDWTGKSVSLSSKGNTVAIGSPFNDKNGFSSGQVKVYEWDTSKWVQRGNDILGNTKNESFGDKVSLSSDGNTLAVGAPGAEVDLDTGLVRVFNWTGNSWIQQGADIQGETQHGEAGLSVSINGSGDTLAFGDPHDASIGQNTGQVRVYNFCNTQSIDKITACDSFKWVDGNTYTSSNNTATYILPGGSSNNCNNTLKLDLTMNQSTTTTDIIDACKNYTWIDGNTYTSSNNTAVDTLTSSAGCDSIIHLDLTIGSIDSSLTQNGNQLSANTSGANYQWLDCENGFAPIPGETNRHFLASTNGEFAVEVAKDGCVDTSSCQKVLTDLVIQESTFSDQIEVYPNPTSGFAIVNLKATYGTVEVVLMNSLGQKLSRSKYENKTHLPLEIQGKSGVYFVQIKTAQETAVLKVLKN